MLSRVAENLYWMSRYVERAENLARLVLVHQNELLDVALDSLAPGTEWHPLLEVTAVFPDKTADETPTYLVSAESNPDSVLNCIFQARENARAIRDQISEAMWVEVNSAWLDLKDLYESGPEGHTTICERAIRSSVQFRGIVESSLSQTDVWAFVELGKFIERADKTSRIVDLPHFLGGQDPTFAWNTILRASTALAAHRQKHGGEVSPTSASTLLLFSTTFPRSVRFCVHRINELLHQISGAEEGDYLNEAERESGLLLARLNFQGVEEIGQLGLHGYVDTIQRDLNQVGVALLDRYFQRLRDTPPVNAEDYVVRRMRAQDMQQQQQQQ